MFLRPTTRTSVASEPSAVQPLRAELSRRVASQSEAKASVSASSNRGGGPFRREYQVRSCWTRPKIELSPSPRAGRKRRPVIERPGSAVRGAAARRELLQRLGRRVLGAVERHEADREPSVVRGLDRDAPVRPLEGLHFELPPALDQRVEVAVRRVEVTVMGSSASPALLVKDPAAYATLSSVSPSGTKSYARHSPVAGSVSTRANSDCASWPSTEQSAHSSQTSLMSVRSSAPRSDASWTATKSPGALATPSRR